jgi:hypothetical protein
MDQQNIPVRIKPSLPFAATRHLDISQNQVTRQAL